MDHRQLRWYLASVATFMLPQSMHLVIYSWLLTIYLAETGDRVGIGQMTTMLPGLLLAPLAGVLAEHLDLRRQLIGIHLLAGVPYLILAAILTLDAVTYPAVLACGLAVGAISAVAQPSRDALVANIAGTEIQKAVTIAVGIAFGVQLIGFGIAASTAVVGPAPLLVGAAILVTFGSFAVTRLSPTPPGNPEAVHVMREFGEAVALVFRSERMGPACWLIFATGLFFGGTYMVAIPLYLREIYGAGAGALGVAFAMFMSGTVLSTVVLVRLGGTARPGRALLTGLAGGVVVLAPLALGPPMPVLFICLFLWGMGGGVVMAMSRTLMQESSPPEFRTRVMALFALGNLGGVPLGALLMGYSSRSLGPEGAIVVACTGIALVVVVTLLTTRTWSLTGIAHMPAPTKPAGIANEPAPTKPVANSE